MQGKWSRWLAAITLVCLPCSPAFAAAIHVGAGGSISAALASAVSGDSVLVQAGTYAEHVTLKSGVVLRGGYDASFSEGSRDPSANRTTIDGSSTGPAITSGSSIAATTVVDGFVLSGGGGSPGAGVLIVGGAPVFSNNEISGNHLAGIAGGVYASGGSTALFVNNTFLSNSSAGSGGGARVESSPCVFVGNTFDGNVAPHQGGALYIFQSAVTCSSNTFRNSVSGEGGGGAVYVQHSTGVTLINSRFENDQASFGGGVFARDESSVTVRDADFVNCHASISGGGIGALTFSTLILANCRFDGCSAALNGGGVWTLQTAVTLTGVEATVASPTMFFRNCTASNNGGGLAITNGSGSVIAGRFTNCHADSMGGGMYSLNSGLVIRRNAVEGCTALEGGGLGLHSNFSNPPRSCVHSNTFSACAGTGNGSGAVTFAAFNNEDNCDFSGNIVANISVGSCLKCRTTSGAGTSRPTLEYSTVSRTIGNPAPILGSTVPSNGCVTAWTSTPSNQPFLPSDITGDGVNPLFCSSPPVDFSMQACSPAIATSGGNDGQCPFTPKADRGAAPDGSGCPCGIVQALEAQTWGQIKARYR